MPAVYDLKHGSPPEPPFLYCKEHGFFRLPEDHTARDRLFTEHQHRTTTHLAYVGDGYIPRCEVCGRLDIPDGMSPAQVVAAHNAQYSVA